MKVWIWSNTPSPYQLDFFRKTAQRPGIELSVRFMRGEHRGEAMRLPAGCDCSIAAGVGPAIWADAFRYHPAVVREVEKGDQDAYILSGQYTSLTFMRLAGRLHARGSYWAVWLERPWPEDYRPHWTRSIAVRFRTLLTVRRWILRRLVGRVPRLLAIGSAAADYYSRMGCARERIAVLPYSCDAARFAGATAGALGERLRRRCGIGRGVLCLYVGQLVKRKGVDTLLQAFRKIVRRRSDAGLVLVGEGPERRALEGRLRGEERARVYFAGSVSNRDLPAYYAAADIFVFPTRYDGWGVVLNEACAAGLPLIASTGAGATQDLLQEGENGFAVLPDDVEMLAEKMETLIADAGLRERMGAVSRRLGEEYSGVHMAERLENILSDDLARWRRKEI